jgi:hypothetical protein
MSAIDCSCTLFGARDSGARGRRPQPLGSRFPDPQNPKGQSAPAERDGVERHIQETSPDGVAFVDGKDVTHVDREEIAKITSNSRVRGALIAGLTGFGIAASLCAAKAGTIVDQNNPTATDSIAGLAVCGGLVGGITGAIGAVGGAEVTLYRPEPIATHTSAGAARRGACATMRPGRQP